jgi:glycyl-tRNA synthetase beta chain
VSNILEKQTGDFKGSGLSEDLLQEPAEHALAAAIKAKAAAIPALVEAGDYASSLASLAELREPVDAFFDQVMVMADDLEVRNNRLQLLQSLRELFLQVADISHLVVTR